MSSLSSPSSSHEIFLYDKTEEDAVNGFVAGLAGSGLHDEPDLNLSGSSSKKRTIRLSANSGSYEEADFRISHPSITEEISDEDSLCSRSRPGDMDSEFEMRLSDGSQYPSRFSLLNLSDGVKEDSETTLEVNNESTIDATLDCNVSQDNIVVDNGNEREGDSVFSPVLSSSFGDFEKMESSRHGSDSSIDSFGDFDNASWVSPATAADGTDDMMTSSHVISREEVDSAVEECYDPSSPTSLILHSSPKKLLDNNFVWVQARSNVTKPSYTWDKLKLHSYLLGALSVRQPISLNRLKLAGPVAAPQKITTSYISSSSSSSRTSNTSASPISSVSFPVSPCDVELGELPHAESTSDVGRWSSRVSSPDVARVSSPDVARVSSPESRVSSPEPSGTSSRPSLTSLIHRKLTSHRRTHSSPIPTVKPASPGTRSLTSSPSIAIRSMTKSNSLESPLSPSSFDETHAGRGLSLLELSDIQTMRHEMKSRVSELSATLITEFQYRGDADHSKEVKKAFVSAFLTAEEKKSKGQLSSRQKALLPIVCNEYCPPTEILVLLTQLLNGLINDTPHTAELLKHYMYMLCRPCFDN